MKPRFFIASLESVFTEKQGFSLFYSECIPQIFHGTAHETAHETAYKTVHEIMDIVRQFGKEIEIIL